MLKIIKLNKINQSYRIYNNTYRTLCTTNNNNSNNNGVYDIVIVGGGLVGSAMACSLGNNNNTKHLKVALIESSPIQTVNETTSNKIPDIRTISFNHQTIDLFKSIGVWDTIESTKRVNPFNQVRVWDTSGFEGIHFKDNNDIMGYIIENKVAVSSLLEKANSFENVDIISPLTVKSLENYNPNTSTTTNILPCLKLSNDKDLHAKLIIGADGGNSIIKKQLKLNSVGRNYNQRAVVCTIKLGKSDHNDTLFQRFLTTGPIALLPLADGYANIIWSTNNLHANYLLELDDNSFLEQLKNSFLSSVPTNNNSVFDALSSVFNLNPSGLSGNEIYVPPIESIVSKRASFPLRIDHTFQYTMPRICFIGDASHIVHPMAGQGVNLGMADVKALTQMIEQSVQSGYDIGDAMMLKRFEEERKPENVKMMLSIDTLFNIFTNNSIAVTALRNFGMSFLNHVPILKNLIVGVSKGNSILNNIK
ncbi:hypothetical protein DICPUDRAFT_154588 [Dictyostelium purpureum]|uniref:Ubiquinone biosynthesis monooxygenase COQ6, mitochondrial n=1 Tax=Dictyostelium purpureum TaxID=5786 RepID=F0ZRQ8_DICPU|nr:uncharacterized protein DICPUDRAFT_154588 [Dictyostelium purpureum]EGC33361.1 hypothetical protein DICPUDRAFT_154588 [Dictyostelium purpureum]|eukprot:XP_003290112.1 hypothetical protein DICPUDRAFT_154588 [Dictyostelium purpureum]